MTDDQWVKMSVVLEEVAAERVRQDEKFGEQNLPNGTGGEHSRSTANIARASCEEAFNAKRGTWKHILLEEYAEATAEVGDEKLRVELIQIAAVCVAWVEAIDRRKPVERELTKMPA